MIAPVGDVWQCHCQRTLPARKMKSIGCPRSCFTKPYTYQASLSVVHKDRAFDRIFSVAESCKARRRSFCPPPSMAALVDEHHASSKDITSHTP